MKIISLALFMLLVGLHAARMEAAENGTGLLPSQPMTNARLESILKRIEPNLKGGGGQWQMVYEGVPVLVLTDESYNRMRIISPAAKAESLDQDILMRMIEANFASALDARYAVSRGIVWAAFIHPLDSLIERDLISGIKQVTTLVKTTGTTYSSSELHFGGSPQQER